MELEGTGESNKMVCVLNSSYVHSFIHLFSSMMLHMQHWTCPFVYYKIYSICTEFQNIDSYKVFITW